MDVFKIGGQFTIELVKFEMLEKHIDSQKIIDSVTFVSREEDKVALSVGRKVMQDSVSIEVKYNIEKTILPQCNKMTDDEIKSYIEGDKNEVTKGFYAYISAMIISSLTMVGLSPIFTSMEYIDGEQK